MYRIAIDLGGTRIKIGVLEDGEMRSSQTIPAHADRGLAANLSRIEETIDTCLAEVKIDDAVIKGFGIAYPGLVDCRNRTIIGSNGKYEDGGTVDVVAWVRRRWNVEPIVDNDARLAAVGEWKYGAAKGHDDVVTVTLGTGIGTGVIIGGRVLRGKRYRAGNLGGHLPLSVDSPILCSCGNRACAEALASTWAMRRDVAREPSDREIPVALRSPSAGYQELLAAANDGNEFAQWYRDYSLRVWGTLTVSLIHAYDPELVVITGSVAAAGDAVVKPIQDYVDANAWTPGYRVPVVRGAHLETAALHGAAYLASVEEYYETI
jgi:glucokinase